MLRKSRKQKLQQTKTQQQHEQLLLPSLDIDHQEDEEMTFINIHKTRRKQISFSFVFQKWTNKIMRRGVLILTFLQSKKKHMNTCTSEKRKKKIGIYSYFHNRSIVDIVIFLIIMFTMISISYNVQDYDTPLSTVLVPAVSTNTTTTYDTTINSQLSPPPSIIHILNTRFMQNQPNLTTLATARLHLFQTFCLPSILNQSNQNYIWIIKIDPLLNEHILNMLLDLVKNVNNGNGENENVFVVKSNVNYMIGSSGIENNNGYWFNGIESLNIWKDIENDNVLTGNISLLRNYTLMGMNHNHNIMEKDSIIPQLQQLQDVIFLETRLDADDGLHFRYIEYIQKDALMKYYKRDRKWNFWCIEKHFKWYPYSYVLHDYNDHHNDNQHHHGVDDKDIGDDEAYYGHLAGERRLDYCITPGLTLGYYHYHNMNDNDDNVIIPTFGHHQLYDNLVRNNNHTNYNCTIQKHTSNKDDHSTTQNNTSSSSSCLSFVTVLVGAIRSRTDTSAGMADIQYRQNHPKNQAIENDHEMKKWIWSKLQNDFHVSLDDISVMHRYLIENEKQIAKENLLGQCTDGHSCKEGSQVILKRLIEKER